MNNNIALLQEIGLISGVEACKIFDEYYQDILTRPINGKWHNFIAELWSAYPQTNANMNGIIFESLIACCLYRAKILPLFVQAKLAFVPNINFDFLAYSKDFGPVILSAKTSLRERYKQADLEGMMMRQVHRKAKSYLLTLHEKEAENVNKKIENGEVLGIDKVILVTTPAFDDLIKELQNLEMCIPEKIEIITGRKIISTKSG